MIDTQDIVDQVCDFVEGILRSTQLDLTCSCEVDDGAVTVSLQGSDSGIALRENARLLYAINHLVNQAFFRKAGGRLSFMVDCNDYRSTRVMELQLLARKAAEKVRYTGQTFHLQAMPAGERRIVHLTLAEEPAVTTRSEGSGLHRRVVIERAKQ
jgi:spoIIIJ-associated protein